MKTCCEFNRPHCGCDQGRDCPAHAKRRAPAWVTPALLLFFIALLAIVGPTIDDHADEFQIANDAIAQQREQARLERIARKVCGDNAGHKLTGDTLQCYTHRGAKTISAKVTP